MRSLQDEIVQVQRDLTCPICGRSFELKDIRIRSFLPSGTTELSVGCDRNHFPVILLVPVTLRELVKAGPITGKEVRSISKKIEALENLQDLYKKN
ncbi:MAG TPA: hypothetical protein VMQ44_03050 [Candidatus Saccharimonadales bacterium]|nr:hypothetical protein [Candidatus Saccharimonadales bacterium]